MFPEIGVSDVSRLTKLGAAALWDFGLDLLGFYECLDSLGMFTHGLGVVGLPLLKALLCTSWQSPCSSGTWGPLP